jgi:hypothetical protein
LGRLTGHPTRSHASVELACGAFRLLAAFLGLLAELAAWSDMPTKSATRAIQRIRVMVAEG